MTLTVIEDFDGEKEEIEYVYVYKEENGELFAYEVDRSGEEDVLVKKYKISETKTDGAKAFKNETSVVYLSEISERAGDFNVACVLVVRKEGRFPVRARFCVRIRVGNRTADRIGFSTDFSRRS